MTVLVLELDPASDDAGAVGAPEGMYRSVAEILRSEIGTAGLSLGYGPKRFVVILPQADGSGVEMLLSRVRTRLDGRVDLRVGIAQHADSIQSAEDMVRRARMSLRAL